MKLQTPTLMFLIRAAIASPLLHAYKHGDYSAHKGIGHGSPPAVGSAEFYYKIMVSALLVVLGGAFAG